MGEGREGGYEDEYRNYSDSLSLIIISLIKIRVVESSFDTHL